MIFWQGKEFVRKRMFSFVEINTESNRSVTCQERCPGELCSWNLTSLFYGHLRKWTLQVSHSPCDCSPLSYTPVFLGDPWLHHPGIRWPCPLFSQTLPLPMSSVHVSLPLFVTVDLVVASSHRHVYRLRRTNCCSFLSQLSLALVIAQVSDLSRALGTEWRGGVRDCRERVGVLSWLQDVGEVPGPST